MKQSWQAILKDSYRTTLLAVLMLLGSKLPSYGGTKVGFLLAQNTPGNNPPESNRESLPPFQPVEPTPPSPELDTLPPLEDLLEEPPPPLPDRQPGDLLGTFVVAEFQLEGNTVFSDEEIEAALQDYIDRPITFTELLQVETVLTKLYTDNGYINSGAVIPLQKIQEGIVKVNIIEGSLEDIEVTVNGRLNEDYVRSRLEKATGTPFNIRKLQEALQLLQLDPLVENLTAELAVGVSRDRWMLDVEVNQANAFAPVVFANNSRTPSVGSFQRGVELNHNNLLGFGDRFSTIYKNTDGSNDIEAGYTFPFNASNGTVGFKYRYVDSDIVEEPFDAADIESETDQYQFVLRQPILLSANEQSTQEVALGLEFSRQSNRITIQDQPGIFPDSGADENGETRVSVFRFFQDWTRRTRENVLAARSQFSVGVDLFDATINENDPDSSFFAWRGQVQWLQRLDSESDINLLLRSDIQLSTSELVPLEQFSIGGISSVRGYRQDVLLGDRGVFASAEVRIPLYRWSNNQNAFSLIPFVDFGTVWGDSGQLDKDTLVSVGAGIQLALSDRLRARLDYGIPLVEIDSTERTAQENGVYFSIEYFPF
ncbi:MAG: ShlB/FhaC/HecB family hemolysin secretion/activation protein [Xenococcaceae cyanobacterium MO_188.B29]|nr:ShlB/FhaC/HecB family hemolysin secretion/activation protein [Xenococcaceae cyanobacterium MO_188.B29]